MESVIKESTNLYYKIDDCITELLKARLDKNTDKEHEAICEMESLLVGTMQNISWLVGELKGCSKIKWNTEEPKDVGEYLVVFEYEDGHTEIQTATWSKAMRGFRHYDGNVRYSLAWCKLSDIEPYKEV